MYCNYSGFNKDILLLKRLGPMHYSIPPSWSEVSFKPKPHLIQTALMPY